MMTYPKMTFETSSVDTRINLILRTILAVMSVIQMNKNVFPSTSKPDINSNDIDE